MANTCMTTVTINGDQDELKCLAKIIDEAMNDPDPTRRGWLGHLLCDYEKEVSHRGEISYFEETDDQLFLDIETAWSPMMGPIKLIVERYAPNAEIIFTAEEPGSEIFVSNDPCVIGMYEVWGSECFPNMPDDYRGIGDLISEKELKPLLEQSLGHTGEMADLVAEMNELDDVSIHRYEQALVDEFC